MKQIRIRNRSKRANERERDRAIEPREKWRSTAMAVIGTEPTVENRLRLVALTVVEQLGC
ncbi:hypothetical protein A2U01_0016256 [Trifolium medium]|uniref:Uncharacterized protein n=1 Tax=Trifolium medium TaxID=97028 RepID=A0A392N6B2_9FABA|nr:hypothetical protein [Trifolium medium]